MSCVFCRIAKKELPAKVVFENRKIIAFHDIQPVAPVHILIVPKKHIPSINHLSKQDQHLIGEMFLIAQQIAKKQKVAKSGYRLIFNIGKDAGQTILHLHLHLIGGKKLPFA